MTNEEYRKYVHEMYVRNFLSKGKTPKAIQIFGDSYGHWISEGTWPHELSLRLNCPVVSFAEAGANNTRTLSFFHHYYDADCLNIVILTSPSRLYLDDNCFLLQHSLMQGNGYVHGKSTLTPALTKKVIEVARDYYTYLFRNELDLINALYMFKGIFYLENVVILNMIDNKARTISENVYFQTTVTDKFFQFYDFTIPHLFSHSLYDISAFQFLTEEYKTDKLINFTVDDNTKKQAHKKYAEFIITGDAKNHMSRSLQVELGNTLGDILLTGVGKFEMKKMLEPTVEEKTHVITPTINVWFAEAEYKQKAIAALGIELLEHHKLVYLCQKI